MKNGSEIYKIKDDYFVVARKLKYIYIIYFNYTRIYVGPGNTQF